MNKRLLVLPVAAACALGVSVLPAGAASSTTIQVKDDVFAPKAKSISKGTKVNFKFVGDSVHNVTFVSGPKKFKASKNLVKGTFPVTFNTSGKYKLTCTIHNGMDLALTVKK